jgi:hypothetical protein
MPSRRGDEGGGAVVRARGEPADHVQFIQYYTFFFVRKGMTTSTYRYNSRYLFSGSKVTHTHILNRMFLGTYECIMQDRSGKMHCRVLNLSELCISYNSI